MSRDKRIVFLVANGSQPRCKKRIDALIDAGADATVYYYERDYFKAASFNCESVSLGFLKHGNYVKRLLVLLAGAFRLRRETGGCSVLYCFGMDMLLLACLGGLRAEKVAYEIADIRPVMIAPGIMGKLIRRLEAKLLKRVDLLVVTAPGFLKEYYHKILGVRSIRSLVVENKLGLHHVDVQSAEERTAVFPVKIGYFGLLRCGRTWEILKELVRRHPDRFNVEVYGRPVVPDDLKAQAELIDGITYHGEFLWPADLPEMYGAIDVVWACYPYGCETPGNWQWAMTNRFYEAGRFEKPVICLKGSADGERVTQLGIGLEVDLSSVDAAVEQLVKMITPAQLAVWKRGFATIPDSTFVYTDEHQRLAELLF